MRVVVAVLALVVASPAGADVAPAPHAVDGAAADAASSAAPATEGATAAATPGAAPAPAPAAAAPGAPAVADGLLDVAPEDLAAAPTTSELVGPMLKTIAALAIVLLVAWLTLHKGMGRLVERAQAGKRMRVIERVSLDARRTLFLVEVDGKTLVLAGGDIVRVDAQASSEAPSRAAAFDKILATTPARPTTPSSPAEPA
jgi:flagellar biogenesis protein FliO